MNVRKVKHTVHIWNYAVFGLVFALAGISLFLTDDDGRSLQEKAEPIVLLPLMLVGLFFVYFCYLVISFWFSHIRISMRSAKLKKAARQNGMFSAPFVPVGSALFSITKQRPQFKNSYRSDSWGYTDFIFSEFSDNYKRERYATNSYYFAVAAFDLPRALPNVFFDSKRSGGREFKLLFREDQRHDLEGDFHTHFATYFTEDYSIDSLTFITPDVMEAFVEANQYDIEIFGNKLYLINELENMPEQLKDIEQKGKRIREAMKRNITRYKDDRIDREVADKTISISGLLLRRSYKKYSILATVGAAISLGSLLAYAASIFDAVAAFTLTVAGLGLCVYAGTFIYDIQKTNRNLRKRTGIY